MNTESVIPSDADVAFFEGNGYWLSGQVLDDETIARACAAMDEVYAGRYETGRAPWSSSWKPGDDPAAIRKTDNAHWANRTLRALATHPTIGRMAARLMKTAEVRLWHDQLLYKPGQGAGANRSGNVGWHQDHGYWRCTVPDLVTAWVALADVTPENGAMQVVPGSHRWGLLSQSDFFDTDLDTTKARIEALTGRSFQTASCTLRAGAVSFHHCLTVHGSGPNTTSEPRRSLVLHLMPDHAVYRAGTPDDNHMNAILLRERGGRHGDLFAGDLWPALHPPKKVSGRFSAPEETRER